MDESKISINLLNTVQVAGVPSPNQMHIDSAAQGPDGRFYLSDIFNHRLIMIQPGGKFIKSIGGAKGDEPGRFWYPAGLLISNCRQESELAVCDFWNHRIQRFDLEGGYRGSFGSIGAGEDQFFEPVSILEEGADSLLILDCSNNRIKKHKPDGACLGWFGKRMSRDEHYRLNDPLDLDSLDAEPSFGFYYPKSFTATADGRLVIADTGNRRLVVVGRNGVLLSSINLDVTGAAERLYPASVKHLVNDFVIVWSIDGHCLIVDTLNKSILHASSLDSGAARFPAFSPIRADQDIAEFFLFDGPSASIKHYEVRINRAAKSGFTPDPFPEDEQHSVVPNKWTEMDRAIWLSHLLTASPGDDASNEAAQVIKACFLSAKTALEMLTAQELDLCKHLVTFHELSEKLKLAKSEGVNIGVITDQVLQETVKIHRFNENRIFLRWTLANEIFSIRDILDSELGLTFLQKEREEFSRIMKSEFAHRKTDFEKTLAWLRECLKEADNIEFNIMVHAFLALLFLLDHLRFTRQSFLRGENDHAIPLDREEFLNDILHVYRTNLTAIPSSILILTASVCKELSFTASERRIYRFGYETDHNRRHFFALKLFDSLHDGGLEAEAVDEALLPAAETVTDNETGLEIFKRLRLCGQKEAAARLIQKLEASLGKPSEKGHFVIKLFDSMQNIGLEDEAISEVLAPASKTVEDARTALQILTRLQLCGLMSEARDLIERIMTEDDAGHEDMILWNMRIKRQKMHDELKPFTVTLSKGQSVEDFFKDNGRLDMRPGCGMRYVDSITYLNPDNSQPIRPIQIRVLDQERLLILDFCGVLFICEGLECRVLARFTPAISDFEIFSPDEIIILSQKPGHVFGGFKIINLSSGAVQSLYLYNQNKLIRDIWRITRADDGGFYLGRSLFNRKYEAPVMKTNPDFKSVDFLPPVDVSSISEVCENDDGLYLSSWKDNTVYHLDNGAQKWSSMEASYTLSPGGVLCGPSGHLFITMERGLGMQVYENGDNFRYQLSALKSGPETYGLGNFSVRVTGDNFLDGNVFIADYNNNKVHLLQTYPNA